MDKWKAGDTAYLSGVGACFLRGDAKLDRSFLTALDGGGVQQGTFTPEGARITNALHRLLTKEEYLADLTKQIEGVGGAVSFPRPRVKAGQVYEGPKGPRRTVLFYYPGSSNWAVLTVTGIYYYNEAVIQGWELLGEVSLTIEV